jgi:hypothetical protein
MHLNQDMYLVIGQFFEVCVVFIEDFIKYYPTFFLYHLYHVPIVAPSHLPPSSIHMRACLAYTETAILDL